MDRPIPNYLDPTGANIVLFNELPVGSRLLVIVNRRNAEGSSRWVTVVASVDGAPEDVTVYVARALNLPRDKRGSIHLRGGGMDMSAELVRKLSQHLHRDPRALTTV